MNAPRCAGLVQEAEGRRLAELAATVPPAHAIVELGSHTGLSTAWMARTSGAAHVTAVDPWADPRPGTLDDPFDLKTGDAVYERFAQNMSDEGTWSKVTPIRGTSLDIARFWVQPVGLLFVDAVHELEHVRSDFLHWKRHLPVGGWLALHDYIEDPDHPYYGVSVAAREILATGQWSEPIVTEYLWTSRRVAA